MSIIQSIIASSYVQAPSGPAWTYPPIGNHYPVVTGITNSTDSPTTVIGYYNESSLTVPQLGMFRRTYNGTAIDGSYNIDSNFPGSYSVAENLIDPYVGFGNDLDVATMFTMQWFGYFKPAQTGDFIFRMNVDDYAMMWIGEHAVSGFDTNTAIIHANNGDWPSTSLAMTAGRYYPVRILYTEIQGGHNCTVWSGLNGTQVLNNQESAATGQFYMDNNSSNEVYPSGLII